MSLSHLRLCRDWSHDVPVLPIFSTQVLSNGESVELPYTHNGIKVLSTGISLILEIPYRKVIVTFGITGFGITLPPRDFVNNTQGHCGKDS